MVESVVVYGLPGVLYAKLVRLCVCVLVFVCVRVLV
jgi:hypothetical protein